MVLTNSFKKIKLLAIILLLIALLSNNIFGQTGTSGKSRKSPWLAGTLSFLLPGAGQFYNGETTKGVIYTSCFGASIFLISWGMIGAWSEKKEDKSTYETIFIIGGIGYVATMLSSVIDASISANSINTENGYTTIKLMDNPNYCLSFSPVITNIKAPNSAISNKTVQYYGVNFKLGLK